MADPSQIQSHPTGEFSFRVGQHLDDASAYVIVDSFDGRVPDPSAPASLELARPISHGASGVVYRAKFKGLDRAIKILQPELLLDSKRRSTASSDARAWAQFQDTFTDEVMYLSRITHTHIAKLLDHGTCAQGPAAGRPYAVMEFIPGSDFFNEAQPETATIDVATFFRLWDQLLSAVGLLHSHGILHCDIKEANVRLRTDETGVEAVLLDLGGARVARADSSGVFTMPPPTAFTFLNATEANTRPEWRIYVGNPIAYATLTDLLFPWHDLHSIGCMLSRMMATRAIKDLFARELDATTTAALEALSWRLMTELRGHESVGEVRRVFQRLNPQFFSPLGVPEFAITANANKSIALPGARVRLTRRIAEIVGLRVFQRLRDLHQLNYVYLLLPGARHSRLHHSLDAYSLCRDYLAHLLDDPAARTAFDSRDIEACLLASLLHDVGHYPLSHMFEDIAHDTTEGTPRHGVYMDDALLPGFLMSRDSVPSGFHSLRPVVASALAKNLGDEATISRSVLEKGFADAAVQRLHALLTRSANDPVGKLLRGVLDSPIDVDKASYLGLDSRFSGVEYGAGIDLDALLAGLCYPEPTELGFETGMLAITDKALAAAEGLILARYWLIRRAYWHHTNRSVMAMFSFVIEALLDAKAMTFAGYYADNLFGSDAEALAFLCALWDGNRATLEARLGAPPVNPLDGLRAGRREIYKRLVTIPFHETAPDSDVTLRAVKSGIGSALELRAKIEAALRARLRGSADVPAGSVLVDLPLKGRDDLGGKLWVYSRDAARVPQDVFVASPLLSKFQHEFELHAKKLRVFVHPKLLRALNSDRTSLESTREAVRQIMRDHYGALPAGPSGPSDPSPA